MIKCLLLRVITSFFCQLTAFSQCYRSSANYLHDPFIKYLALESKIIKIMVTNVWIGNSLKWFKMYSGKRFSFNAVKAELQCAIIGLFHMLERLRILMLTAYQDHILSKREYSAELSTIYKGSIFYAGCSK